MWQALSPIEIYERLWPSHCRQGWRQNENWFALEGPTRCGTQKLYFSAGAHITIKVSGKANSHSVITQRWEMSVRASAGRMP